MTDKRNIGELAKNIVLVHGGFVDGSGWQGVYDTLRKKGYNVAIVQNPRSHSQTTWRPHKEQ
jgi:pimeloyl-ACP methyl ester carboxylesterase